MPHSQSAKAAAERFVAEVLPRAPLRLEAKVLGADGMPLLCAVEAALAGTLPRSARQELVWLGGASPLDRHVLSLRAFGAEGELLAEATHEFAS